MKIDLLRHGETQAGRCFLGSTDARLSENGWQQMEIAVAHHSYQKIISSPLARCTDFAQHLAKNKNIPITLNNDLREIHFGDWEAKTTDYLWEKHQKQLTAFWNDPMHNMPPNAEPLIGFQTRVNAVFENIIRAKNEDNMHILVIAHGGVIRQIVANILSIPYTKAQLIRFDYASVSRVYCYEGQLSIGFTNYIVNDK